MNRRTRHASMAVAGLLATIAALAASGCGSSSADSGSAATASAGTTSAAVPQVAPPPHLLHHGALTLGASLTYPPLGYLDNGKQAGLDPELSDVVAKLMGLTKDMTNVSFESLIPGLQAHKYDAVFSSVFITKARAKAVDFVPYFQTGQAFVVKKGSSFAPQTAGDLCGHTVAVLKGSYNETLANGQIKQGCGGDLKVRSFPTDPEATTEVQAGRADVLFTAREVAFYRASQPSGANLEVASKAVLYPVAVGIAVRKGDAAMKASFAAAIQQLTANGKLVAILKQYGLEPATASTVSASLKG